MLRGRVLGFAGRGTYIPERRVQTLTIIKQLDVLDQCQPHRGPRGHRLVQLVLSVPKKLSITPLS